MRTAAAIYSGKGAVLFPDVAYTLGLLKIDYTTVDETKIKSGALLESQVFIVPGGYTPEYMPAFGEKGKEAVRSFVKNGGGYIGICAGAYIVTSKVEVPGKPEGLGIIDIENIRKSGRGKKRIYLAQHPITEGLGKELEIYYQNGPNIIAGQDVTEVARYKGGKSAVVAGNFGEGKVVIFSPHPEASITQGIEPSPETLKLLKNTINF